MSIIKRLHSDRQHCFQLIWRMAQCIWVYGLKLWGLVHYGLQSGNLGQQHSRLNGVIGGVSLYVFFEGNCKTVPGAGDNNHQCKLQICSMRSIKMPESLPVVVDTLVSRTKKKCSSCRVYVLTRHHACVSFQSDHRRTTSSTSATAARLASTSNHSRCSLPQAEHFSRSATRRPSPVSSMCTRRSTL